jgi:DNA polymerase III epsilon subunit-like protein
MKDILIFDVETTGLPPRNAKYDTDYNSFPHIVQIAWWFNGVHRNHIIKPVRYEIPEETTEIHGITTEQALEEGELFQAVILDFLEDCLIAKKIIAHNVYFDVSIVKANILRVGCDRGTFDNVVSPALDKSKRIDTMMKTIKFVDAKYPDGRGGKWPRLEELYFKLFEETFPAHNAHEDVKALLRCIEPLVENGVIVLS